MSERTVCRRLARSRAVEISDLRVRRLAVDWVRRSRWRVRLLCFRAEESRWGVEVRRRESCEMRASRY
jgi:hypothetical protein